MPPFLMRLQKKSQNFIRFEFQFHGIVFDGKLLYRVFHQVGKECAPDIKPEPHFRVRAAVETFVQPYHDLIGIFRFFDRFHDYVRTVCTNERIGIGQIPARVCADRRRAPCAQRAGAEKPLDNAGRMWYPVVTAVSKN